MDIKLAHIEDLDGVLALLKANHVSQVPEEERKDGFVTTNGTVEQMAALIEEQKGVTIAREEDEIPQCPQALRDLYLAEGGRAGIDSHCRKAGQSQRSGGFCVIRPPVV